MNDAPDKSPCGGKVFIPYTAAIDTWEPDAPSEGDHIRSVREARNQFYQIITERFILDFGSVIMVRRPSYRTPQLASISHASDFEKTSWSHLSPDRANATSNTTRVT